MIKKIFLSTLILLLLSNNIPAHADKFTTLRYKAIETALKGAAMKAALKGAAMEEEMHKFTAQREKAMKAALKSVAMKAVLKGAAMEAALKGAPQRFFFTLSQGLGLSRPEKGLMTPAQSIFPFRMLIMR